MTKLFPDLKKVKNEEEMIEILLMVVDDTYVKSNINGLYETIFATLFSFQSAETPQEPESLPNNELPKI